MTENDTPACHDAHRCTAEQLFAAVWEAMSDVLGTATTATLMRRSIKRATAAAGGLEGLEIHRQGFEYSYTVPQAWSEDRPELMVAMRGLARELSPLLHQLTGPIVLRRLNTLPELRRCELSFQEHVE